MISEYINPRQAIGDLFLAAVKDASLKLIEPEEGEQLTDGQRRSNIGTILQYAARFVTSLEVKDNPLFSLQYIDNFQIVTRTILNRDLPSNEICTSATQHFNALISQMNPASSRTDFYESVGGTIDSSEEAFAKSSFTITDKEMTPKLRDLIEMGYAILWGSYKISKGKPFAKAISLMSQSVDGALKGATISDYKGILGGAIAHTLIAENLHAQEAREISFNSN